jgi:choline-phosphate cytidylyltransferase
VAHDDLPYKSGSVEDVYKFVKEQGRFLATKRTEDISTSDLITRIVHDYDEYLRRNLNRGYSAKDLNISIFKETHLKLKDSVEEWATKLQSKWRGTKGDFKEMIQQWEDKSQDLVWGFLSFFSPDGVVVSRRKLP